MRSKKSFTCASKVETDKERIHKRGSGNYSSDSNSSSSIETLFDAKERYNHCQPKKSAPKVGKVFHKPLRTSMFHRQCYNSCIKTPSDILEPKGGLERSRRSIFPEKLPVRNSPKSDINVNEVLKRLRELWSSDESTKKPVEATKKAFEVINEYIPSSVYASPVKSEPNRELKKTGRDEKRVEVEIKQGSPSKNSNKWTQVNVAQVNEKAQSAVRVANATKHQNKDHDIQISPSPKRAQWKVMDKNPSSPSVFKDDEKKHNPTIPQQVSPRKSSPIREPPILVKQPSPRPSPKKVKEPSKIKPKYSPKKNSFATDASVQVARLVQMARPVLQKPQMKEIDDRTSQNDRVLKSYERPTLCSRLRAKDTTDKCVKKEEVRPFTAGIPSKTHNIRMRIQETLSMMKRIKPSKIEPLFTDIEHLFNRNEAVRAKEEGTPRERNEVDVICQKDFLAKTKLVYQKPSIQPNEYAYSGDEEESQTPTANPVEIMHRLDLFQYQLKDL